jgi:hypothetical protein
VKERSLFGLLCGKQEADKKRPILALFEHLQSSDQLTPYEPKSNRINRRFKNYCDLKQKISEIFHVFFKNTLDAPLPVL